MAAAATTLSFGSTAAWQPLFRCENEFRKKQRNFLKGVRWSPEGTCVLAAADDRTLRLFVLCVRLSLSLSFLEASPLTLRT